jgi:zinc protease
MCSLLILVIAASLCCASASAQKPIPLPDLTFKRLLNDLQVLVIPTPLLGDDMTIGLVVRYGAIFDNADKGGTAYLLSRMFMKATEDRTAKDIQDELALLGATLEIRCDWDGFRFTLRGQSSKLDRSLLLLFQVVAEAQLLESDFAAVKKEILSGIQNPQDPRQRIHAQFEDILFSKTSYGRPIEGTEKSLSNITLGDVRLFYRKFFSPNESTLLIAGNVSSPTALQRASRIWGVWVRNDQVPFSFLTPRNPAGRQIYIEDDPSSPAAQFIIGNLFPRRDDPAYVGAILTARILQDRLNRLLPTSLLTVGSDGRRMPGPFYIQGQAAADQAADQIRKIQATVEELKTTPVSKEELASAQKYLVDEFTRDIGTTNGLCRIMLEGELYRLGSNFAATFPEQIYRCDAGTIIQTAKERLFASGEVLLLRGPAAILKPALESLGTAKALP